MPGCKYIYASKSLFSVFFQTDVKYFTILLRQESSNQATDISKLTNEQRQGLPAGNLSVKDICQFSTNAQKLPIAETESLQLSLSETTSCYTGKSKTLSILL